MHFSMYVNMCIFAFLTSVPGPTITNVISDRIILNYELKDRKVWANKYHFKARGPWKILL